MRKIIIIASVLMIFSSACNEKDFFELERPPESPWQKIQEFDRAVIGPYKYLFAHSAWRNPYDIWYTYKNAVADDAGWATPGDATWGWYRDTENNKSLLDELYEYSHVAISSVNDALRFVEESGGDPFPDISLDDKKYNVDRVIGELYFLRGFGYYMNATLFVDAYVPDGANDSKQMPLRITSASSYESATNAELATVEKVWSLILSDFQKAFELLPERFISSKMHPSYEVRANKFAAAAMLCRTYFAMGNYDKAKKFASFVIDQNGGDFDLSEDPIEAFNNSVMLDGGGKETVFYIPSAAPSFMGGNYMSTTFSHLYLTRICSWVAIHMDAETLKRIGWMDDVKNDTTINSAARIDKRFQQLMFVREPANVPEEERIEGRVYESRVNLTYRTIVANKYFRGPDVKYTNVPIIRLPEMYLTRAICSFKDGNKNSAASDLNIVRKRAWDSTVAGVSYEQSNHYVTSDNITEQMISDERLIEMFMEGDRIDYLRGLKVNVGNGDRGPGSVPYTDKGFVWPLPIKEQNLNDAIKN